jgi:hypothetical protein
MQKVKSQNTPHIEFFTVTDESFKFDTELPIKSFVFTSVPLDLQYLLFTLKFFMLKSKIKRSFFTTIKTVGQILYKPLYT